MRQGRDAERGEGSLDGPNTHTFVLKINQPLAHLVGQLTVILFQP